MLRGILAEIAISRLWRGDCGEIGNPAAGWDGKTRRGVLNAASRFREVTRVTIPAIGLLLGGWKPCFSCPAPPAPSPPFYGRRRVGSEEGGGSCPVAGSSVFSDGDSGGGRSSGARTSAEKIPQATRSPRKRKKYRFSRTVSRARTRRPRRAAGIPCESVDLALPCAGSVPARAFPALAPPSLTVFLHFFSFSDPKLICTL